MTPTAPPSDPARRRASARPALRGTTDFDVDTALRRAFADLEAPPPIEFGGEPVRVARDAVDRRPWTPVLAAAVVFVLCAASPMLIARSELAMGLGEAMVPWLLRCAPALALPAWMWLERAPARGLPDVETG